MSYLKEKIKKRLDEYLEFDSDDLFSTDCVRIFGGAIRDSIADMEIHDVDILCAPISHKKVSKVLKEKGYKYNSFLNGKDIQGCYKEISIITEPHTWIKGDKIIQLIKPTPFGNSYVNSFKELIKNVDLSCCGVSYDKEGLYEDFDNSILHCLNRVFSVNRSARMYSTTRTTNRVIKLEERGWSEMENNLVNNRNLKLNNILDI